MIHTTSKDQKEFKQRLTAFINPELIKRAKIRAALEGLTISDIVEKALEEYAPKIEHGPNKQVNLKFTKGITLKPATK